jgi:AcrR family transcriptional regulator
MAARSPDPDAPAGDPTGDGAADGSEGRDVAAGGGPGPVQRRAPFAANPNVGARGQRTQQRILDAAIQVFGEEGYHRCSVDGIAKLAGCSRVSFYQYFSDKQDLFRQLAGQVARQQSAAIEALHRLTPDQAGWDQLHSWITRRGDVYERYQPVFDVFEAAAEGDEAVLAGAQRTTDRNVALLHSKVESTTIPSDRVDAVLLLLMGMETRTFDNAAILRTAAPASYERARVELALTDVVHRTLFGLQSDVNVHPPADERPPVIGFGPEMRALFDAQEDGEDLTDAGRKTLEVLLQAGRDVLVRRGYQGTRVDDIAKEAGLSHGAFYRYFKNKDHLARLLAARALRTVSSAFAEIPADDGEGGGPDGLRPWLRSYNSTQGAEAAMIRVWVDASAEHPASDSAAVYDWGRRRMARYLRPRDFGDVDTEGLVLMALLGSFGSRPRTAAEVDGAALVIERGLLGR